MFSGAVMKKLATCLIGVVGLIGTPAFAADMAVKAPRPLPAPAPVFSWTGCYLGGYAGGAWHESDGASFTDLGQNGLGAAGSIAKPPFMSYSGGAVAARIVPQHSWSADLDSTFIGGGTLGCNGSPSARPSCSALKAKAATCV
jgi:outer membrane immunogenic protein